MKNLFRHKNYNSQNIGFPRMILKIKKVFSQFLYQEIFEAYVKLKS